MRQRGISAPLLGAGLLGALVALTGCGSGGGSSLQGAASARTASLTGRLVAPAGDSVAGTRVTAELVIGGRTALLRAISAASDSAHRAALIDAAQSGERAAVPGLYETTAMGNGSFVFRSLPEGEYSLMARRGDTVAVLPNVHVGGAQTAAPRVMQLAAAGTISGKVRYPHPEEVNPDNSGILAFVKGTSLVGYTQGSAGDYQIGNVPQQQPEDRPYTIGAIAGGLADDEIAMFERLTGTSAQVPLIIMERGVTVTGRVSDPTITVIDRQGLGNVQLVTVSGQSAATDAEGFFTMRGLRSGFNHLTITRSNYRTIRQQIGPLEPGVTAFLSFTMQRQ